ncbi:transaldolase [Cardiobacteriaceae bacterium TAE3-ERU3]|nr:transaldolase [Cardiobacteriaceae bacterium TAE3-ERU3]
MINPSSDDEAQSERRNGNRNQRQNNRRRRNNDDRQQGSESNDDRRRERNERNDNGNDRNNNDRNNKDKNARNDRKRRDDRDNQREDGNEQRQQRNDKNDSRRNQRDDKETRDDNQQRNQQADKKAREQSRDRDDQKRNEQKAHKDNERNNKQKPVQDDVNQSIEELSNPPSEIDGRQVRKGRPRDVHAVRGQGKAGYQPAAEQGDSGYDGVQDTSQENDVAADRQDEPRDDKAAQNDEQSKKLTAAPSGAQSNAPGMVSLLAEQEDDTAVEQAQAPEREKAKAQRSKASSKKAQNAAEVEAKADKQADSAKAETAAEAKSDTADTAVEQEPVEAPAKRRSKKSEPAVVDVAEREEESAKPQATSPLNQLPALGQSIWFDNIHRRMLAEGELTAMIKTDDLRGVTSNPAIFQKAMTDGDAYDAGLNKWLSENGNDPREAFFALAIEDIQQACDQMKPVYEQTDGTDGMVSLEVSPDIAHDADKTIAEALSLHKRVNRENVMIKVPGTKAGLKAITELTAEGLNINVTLLFSVVRYQEVLEAYIEGLKQRVAAGKSIDMIRSVASFFVSRVDSKIDDALSDEHADLRGRAAIANAQLAYAYYLERISHDDWIALAQKGAAVQRLLWASTGTKNPNYSDVRYVDQLIGADTVNTVPPATYAAFKDHGRASVTLMRDIDKAGEVIQAVRDAGVNVDEITDTLEKEGVAQFEASFADLLNSLQEKIDALRAAEQKSEAAQPAANESAEAKSVDSESDSSASEEQSDDE